VKKMIIFLRESREEFRKVTWPSRDEVTRFTVVTVITLFIVAMFLWVVDSALLKIIRWVMQ
jgi:preprotein translocase subunit SecE